jgi:hypothetical protein
MSALDMADEIIIGAELRNVKYEGELAEGATKFSLHPNEQRDQSLEVGDLTSTPNVTVKGLYQESVLSRGGYARRKGY